MSTTGESSDAVRGLPHAFVTTHWSLVLAAGDMGPKSAQALENLCRTYWYPLYAYVRRRGHDEHEAKDLTQAFFLRLIEKSTVSRAQRERGRFRTFLLSSLQNFLADEWDRQRAEKRGGRHGFISLDSDTAEARYALEKRDELTPEKIFERRWAMTLLDTALAQLREEYVLAGKADSFDALKDFIGGDNRSESYAQVGQRLNTSEAAIKMSIQRLRQRFRQLLRAEIATTVASPPELEEELRHIAAVLRG